MREVSLNQSRVQEENRDEPLSTKSPAPQHPFLVDLEGVPQRWIVFAAGVLLALVVALVYSNALHGAFHYDDFLDIGENPTLRHLWPLKDVFYIQGQGALSRPVVNLTFALNYAIRGFTPFPFHLTNVAIHMAATLFLFGVLRRTFSLPTMQAKYEGRVLALSVIGTGLWALHPLLTESVSYAVQRYESLMGCFALATFYCLLRLEATKQRTLWTSLGVASCLLSLGSKEVAVSLPLLILLFDRTFMSGSFREAFQRRKWLYLGFLVDWLCFLAVQTHVVKRDFAGLGLTTPWWEYALNQPGVIFHYLRMAIWPHPLNFDYFWPLAKSWKTLVLPVVGIAGLLVATVWALFRAPRLAFPAVCFFLLLAPTSSVMPILDLAVEHRMYLPLAPVVVLLVLGLDHLLQRGVQDSGPMAKHRKIAVICLAGGVLATMAIQTYLRNEDYRDSLDLWRVTVQQSPKNPRAHHNYAFHLQQAGNTAEALRQYELAIKLAPTAPTFRSNYGVLLGRLGRYQEALEQLRMAIQLDPKNQRDYINLGGTLLAKGSLDSARTCFREVLSVFPASAPARGGLAAVALAEHRYEEAAGLVQEALILDPKDYRLHFILGLTNISRQDWSAAEPPLEAAMRFSRDPGRVASEAGWSFHAFGNDRLAVIWLRRAVALSPKSLPGRVRLGLILATSSDDSVRNGREAHEMALGLLADQAIPSPELLDLLAVSLAELGRREEAANLLRQVIENAPAKNADWLLKLQDHLSHIERGEPVRDASTPSAAALTVQP